tara:strand:+ start:1430 stop:2296 length:867 start_codon:yes stop_codon:yes gene_type:complete
MENNLNKQIKRIKSLFSEERLYGNIINEQSVINPDTNSDGQIDATEFSASGDIIDFDEAQLFVNNKLTDNPNLNSALSLCMQQPVISKAWSEFSDDIKPNTSWSIKSDGGVCFLKARNTNNVAATTVIKISNVSIWANKYVTFYTTLGTPIDLSDKTVFEETMNTHWDRTCTGCIEKHVLGNKLAGITQKIKWFRWQAPITDVDNMKYGQVFLESMYDDSGEKIRKGTRDLVLEYINNMSKRYNPIIGGSRAYSIAKTEQGLCNEALGGGGSTFSGGDISKIISQLIN